MMHIRTHLADRDDEMNYAVAYLDGCDGLPLMVYLHGAGERGRCFDNVYRNAIPRMIREGHDFPAVVLFPQCPTAFTWNNMVKELKSLIDSVVEEYGIERDRILLTGSSMGGYGTWEMAMCYPETFAAIAPVAGGGAVWRTPRLAGMPVLAYHGEVDTVVPLSQSQSMVEFATRNGALAELTVIEGAEHSNGIEYAYRETKLVDRLLTYRKSSFDRVPEVCEEIFAPASL